MNVLRTPRKTTYRQHTPVVELSGNGRRMGRVGWDCVVVEGLCGFESFVWCWVVLEFVEGMCGVGGFWWFLEWFIIFNFSNRKFNVFFTLKRTLENAL